MQVRGCSCLMVPGATKHEIPLLVGPYGCAASAAAALLLRLGGQRRGGRHRGGAALVLLDQLRLHRHARRRADDVVVEVAPQKGSRLQCDQMLLTYKACNLKGCIA